MRVGIRRAPGAWLGAPRRVSRPLTFSPDRLEAHAPRKNSTTVCSVSCPPAPAPGRGSSSGSCCTWCGLGWGNMWPGREHGGFGAELTATMELAMAAGLMVLVVVRGSRRPWVGGGQPSPGPPLPPTPHTHAHAYHSSGWPCVSICPCRALGCSSVSGMIARGEKS